VGGDWGRDGERRYAINSILYQRGIYPPETFAAVGKYGLSLLVTTDEGLKSYLAQVLTQISSWLLRGEVQKLVVVVTGVETHDTLERWVFNVETDRSVTVGGPGKVKPEKEIQAEIQAIVRQITASVTFLPLLDEPCAFDLLVYTDSDADVPRTWEESDPRYIARGEEVRLRSFTTKVHKVDASVSYKAPRDDDV
jgi:mitotic spindle assembly checkpoint protein MAD2